MMAKPVKVVRPQLDEEEPEAEEKEAADKTNAAPHPKKEVVVIRSANVTSVNLNGSAVVAAKCNR